MDHSGPITGLLYETRKETVMNQTRRMPKMAEKVNEGSVEK